MIKTVHIPIFCGSEEAKSGAFLTLKTIRVGFPNTYVCIHWTGGSEKLFDEMCALAKANCLNMTMQPDLTNDKIIKQLADQEKDSFAVVDSDVVFFENCEDYEPGGVISGEFTPEFVCPAAKAVTASRLHTAFFVVDKPATLNRVICLAYKPLSPRFCPFNPFSPVTVFDKATPRFYDSCSVLYHAIGGYAFDRDMLKRFEHLHGGSWAPPGLHRDRINAAYENPETARGVRAMVSKFMRERKP